MDENEKVQRAEIGIYEDLKKYCKSKEDINFCINILSCCLYHFIENDVKSDKKFEALELIYNLIFKNLKSNDEK